MKHFYEKNYLCVCFFLISISVFSQEKSLSGVVTDSFGLPMPGVNVVVKGTDRGTQTNFDGEYTLQASPGEVLSFSFLGKKTIERTVGEGNIYNVVLEEGNSQLEEVVVVGYGAQKREDVTGAVSVVSMENIRDIPVTSPADALMGQVAGVNVTQATGLPGSAPQFQLRGVSAAGAGGEPLYVVDGFALPQPSNQVEARLRNPLTNIPQQDIQSITVLKDASATAIYGSRASNGVVIITTKSGRASQEPSVNVNFSKGISAPIMSMLPEMANAREFAEFQKFRWENRVATGQATEVPQVFQNPEEYGEGTDWFDVVTEIGQTTNANVSISGGNQQLRSYVSAGYMEQDGSTPGVDFKRISARANIDASLSEKLDVSLRLAPTYSIRNQPGSGQEGRDGAFGSALMINPLVPAYDDNGDIIPYPSLAAPEVPGTWTHPNPVYLLNNVTDRRNDFRLLTTFDLGYEIVEGLTARSTFNVDYGRDQRKYFYPSYVGATNDPPYTIPPEGSESEGTRLNWLSETTINYQNTNVGPGKLEFLAGFTAQEQAIDHTLTFAGIFPDNNVRTLNVASDITGSSNEESWSLLSGLSRLNYSFLDERYVFTGTVRADGSSRFGEENRWGVFPSVALAWNISNEPFYGDFVNEVPQFRARLSFGKTGNNQIGNFSALGVIDRADYLFGNSVTGGRALTTFANRILGWEITREWNFGIDATLVNSRLDFTMELYNRETQGMLLNRELTTTSGFSSVVENAGTMVNRGIEMSLDAVPISTDNLLWKTGFNFALNRNEVTSLPGGEAIIAGGVGGGRPTHITQVGEPIGQFYGFIVEGIFQTPEEVASSPIFGGEVPGNQKFRDVNGDGVITPEGDFAVIGSPHPDFTFGFNTALFVGKFELSANFTGSVGGEIARQEYYRTAMNIDGLFNVAREYAVNFWRSEEEPGDGRMPTPLGGGQARGFFRTSHSDVVASNSNLWLRNAVVRYNFTDLPGIRTASVYLSGQNLFVLTPYPGNPDAQRNEGQDGDFGALIAGGDFLGYPIPRIFSLGVDVSF